MRPVTAASLILSSVAFVSAVVFVVQSCSRRNESRHQAIVLAESVQEKSARAGAIAQDGERVLQVTDESMRRKGLAVGVLAQELEGKRATLDALVQRHQTASQERRRNLEELGQQAARAGAEISVLKETTAKVAGPPAVAMSASLRDEVARLERVVASLKRRVLEEEIERNREELLVEDMLSLSRRIDAARDDAASAAMKIAEGRSRNAENQKRMAQLRGLLSVSRGKLDAILERLKH